MQSYHESALQVNTAERPVSFFASTKSNAPESETLTLETLAGLPPQVVAGVWNQAKSKFEKPPGLALWSPAVYAPGATRGNANVRCAYFLALDLDGCAARNITAEDAEKLLANLSVGPRACVQTTYNHRPEAARLRVTWNLSRPVSAAEYQTVWQVARTWLGEILGFDAVDAATKDPSRAYYVPAVPSQEAASWYRSVLAGGADLDVDQWLAHAAKAEPKALVSDAEKAALRAVKVPPPRKGLMCPRGTEPEAWFTHLCETLPPAVEGQSGERALMQLANYGVIGLELAPEVAGEIAWERFNDRCEPPWETRDGSRGFDRKFTEAKPQGDAQPGYLLPKSRPEQGADGNGHGDERAKRNHEAAIRDELEEHFAGAICFDEFACQVRAMSEIGRARPGDWTDHHSLALKEWLQRFRKIYPSTEALNGAVELFARENSFHPVRDYLSGLQWDGVPRLNTMLVDCFAVPESYYAERVGRCWMISAVARAMNPGCKVDHMLILKGAQGLGKSSGLRALAGHDWFSDTALDFGSKDSMSALPGKWVIEIGELQSFRRAEVTSIKAFITSPVDIFRPAYGRRDQKFPRSVVFAGTTNSDVFLQDTTGNRRFWVVECAAHINVAKIEATRDQLWAEAVHAYRSGEKWWLSSADEELAAEVQTQYEDTEDPWETPLAGWLATGPRAPTDSPQLEGSGFDGPLVRGEVIVEATTSWILERVCTLPKAHQKDSHSKRLAALLRKHGWKRVRRVAESGARRWVYVAPGANTDRRRGQP